MPSFCCSPSLCKELALLLSQSARILETFLDFGNQGVHVRFLMSDCTHVSE